MKHVLLGSPICWTVNPIPAPRYWHGAFFATLILLLIFLFLVLRLFPLILVAFDSEANYVAHSFACLTLVNQNVRDISELIYQSKLCQK